MFFLAKSKKGKERLLLALILILFLGIRLAGIDLPYHQDEQKYVTRGVMLQGIGVTSGHPPLLGIIMTGAGFFFGDEYFRLMSIIFGVGSLLVLYFLLKNLLDINTALWASFLYAISPYGVWSSLMVDVDGAVLPLFAFTAFFLYTLFLHRFTRQKWLFGVFLLLVLALGLLVKLSFVLVLAAIGADVVVRFWQKGYHRTLYIGAALIVLLPLAALVFVGIISAMLPSFNFGETISHAQDYIRFSGRNYGQVVYQLLKMFLYLSPLLVMPLLFIDRNIFRSLRLIVFYFLFSLVFYLIVFDFSSGALDKYLMVVILPLAALSGAALARMQRAYSLRWLSAGLIVGLGLVLTQFLPHFVPALYPKGEWLGRIVEFRWNFLIPFMGGSGPLGFYSSWLFLGLSWVVVIGSVVLALIKHSTVPIRSFVLTIGIIYSLVMLADMLFGFPHGSSKKVLQDALGYVEKTNGVKSVITFNDTGGYYLAKMNKYTRRMFAVPKYEEEYRDILNKHNGHVLVVDIPRIYKNSVYWRYVTSCRSEFVSNSAYISATLYNCSEHIKL